MRNLMGKIALTTGSALIAGGLLVIAYLSAGTFILAGILAAVFLIGEKIDVVQYVFAPIAFSAAIIFAAASWALTALGVGSFATMTLLTKNSFLDEIRKQYVMTARAKGLSENQVLYRHVFRNAMLIVIAGFPGAFVGAFFSGSLLIETIFSLDGLGLLGWRAAIDRDYPLLFATLYIFGLFGLLTNLLSDITYTLIDPRIDFETREV